MAMNYWEKIFWTKSEDNQMFDDNREFQSVPNSKSVELLESLLSEFNQK